MPVRFITRTLLLTLATGIAQAQTPPTTPQRPTTLPIPPAKPSPPKLDLSCMKPEVKEIAYATKVSPGESFTIKGCGYSKVQGKVLLKGKFNQGFLKLDVMSWNESQIEARVPSGATGIPDHDAQIVVEDSNGLPSAEKKFIAFKADRETRLLRKGDFDFACQNSSYGYGNTHCSTIAEIGFYGLCGQSICYGQKLFPSPDPNAFANLNNHPTFNVKLKGLKNGWVVKSHNFESDSGADFFIPPIPVPDKPKLTSASNGGTNTNFAVKATNIAPTGWYWFKLKVEAEGPKGVAHDKEWAPN